MPRFTALILALVGIAPAAASAATITNVAGTGEAGYAGDGGPATAAKFVGPRGVAPMPSGGFLVADRQDHRVRYVGPDGIITTVAGNGTEGGSGDGGPATQAQLGDPIAVSSTGDGGFLIADELNRIRRVAPDGIITTVAGTGTRGGTGDGTPATGAALNNPSGVAAEPDGGFLIADLANSKIRRVDPSGIIHTVAGGGNADPGDGGPATDARLHGPVSVELTADGGFLVVERDIQRVRKVAADGTISTVAGNGTVGFSGDGGLATSAQLHTPTVAWPTADGGFLILDRDNSRVRKVSPTGIIDTVAGGGSGTTRDNLPHPATEVGLVGPTEVAALGGNDFLVTQDNRISKVADDTTPPPGDSAAPALTGLTITPRTFKSGHFATVKFKLSESARVTFRLERAKKGHRSGKRCVPGAARKHACKYFKLLGGSFGTDGKLGANTYHYNGRLKGVKLAAADYRLIATPVDAAGNKGRAVKAAFKVKRK